MNSAQMQRTIDELQRHCDSVRAGEAQLTTPPGIKFLVSRHGKVIGLYFNGGKQCLGYCEMTKQYEVHAVYRSGEGKNLWTESECLPLTPCKYGDLEAGDFYSITDTPGVIGAVRMVIPDGNVARIDYNEDITVINHNSSCWKIGK